MILTVSKYCDHLLINKNENTGLICSDIGVHISTCIFVAGSLWGKGDDNEHGQGRCYS
jgi:hypothetical protein